jgi:hypothetical protein
MKGKRREAARNALTFPTLPRPFRFEEFWTRDPTCDIVIQEAWSVGLLPLKDPLLIVYQRN